MPAEWKHRLGNLAREFSPVAACRNQRIKPSLSSHLQNPARCSGQIGADVVGLNGFIQRFGSLDGRREMFAGLHQYGAATGARAGDDVRNAISHP